MEANNDECLGQFNKDEKMNLPECKIVPKRNVSIKSTYGQAFSLSGQHLPRFDGDKDSILDIIDFLDVERSKRYAPTKTSTYCNIYAHDYADLMGAFLPRTWWTEEAIKEKNFNAVYGKTCRELNANSLYEWFEEYGSNFGWRKLKNSTEAQKEANNLKCVIMVAANKNRAKSGHIVAVVPEHDDNLAIGARGIIIYPLQSQAGRRNRKFFAKKWWSGMEDIRIYAK